MNRSKLRAHWIVWPVLVLAVLGLVFPLLWPRLQAEAGRLPLDVGSPGGSADPTQPNASGTVEQPLTLIPMTGRLAEPQAEISGLAWFGDYLILLPQYPRHVTGGEEGYIYALKKQDILDYLDGKSSQALDPISIRFDAYKLRDQMKSFQGFEAIGFQGDRAYVTVESGVGTDMMGYLLAGKVEPDLSRIVMDSSRLVAIQPQAQLSNKAEEALLVLDDRILTFYEVNGAQFNPQPVVHVFDLELQEIGTLPSTGLEYRLTDAARQPGTDRFWVIDSFFLADIDLLPESDPLADAFGKGPTHSRFPMVERLVEMQFDPEAGVSLTGTPPIQLQLQSMETRNWEGLVLLDDRGFLIATDKYPGTLLAFVPKP